MRTIVRIALLLGFFCLCTMSISTSNAEDVQANASVSGFVTNQATGEPLVGASVTVEGSDIFAATDRDGYYSLTLPPGERVLVVQFTGLDSARIPLNVEPGARLNRKIELTSEVYVLAKFTVTGIREGTAKAIQLQRLSPNMKTVVATDTFGNPASNPGELVGRLSGVTYEITGSEIRSLSIRGMGTGFTKLLVDGNEFAFSNGSSIGRRYQIEQYGTGNVETAELIKAPTPDMDANAIGGYVNMVSKRAFDRPGRQINLTLGTNWRQTHGGSSNPSTDRADNLDLVVFDFSQAYDFMGGAKNLGVAFNFSRRVASTLEEQLGSNLTWVTDAFDVSDPAKPIQTVFGAGFFQYPDYVNYNGGLNFDLRANENTVLYLRSTFNKNSYEQAGFQWQAVAGGFEPGSTYELARTTPNSTINIQAIPLPKFSQNWSINPGLEHKFMNGGGELKIDAAYSHAVIWYPGNVAFDAELTGIAWELDRRGRDSWTPAFKQISGPSINDPANFTPTGWYSWTSTAPTDHWQMKADFRRDLSLAVPAYIKTGIKYSHTDYEFSGDTGSKTYAGPDGVIGTPDDKGIQHILAGPYLLGGGRYGPFPMLAQPKFGGSNDPAGLPESYWVQSASQAYSDTVSSVSADVNMKETLWAAYVSGHITLGKVKVLAGLRFEATSNEGTSYSQVIDDTSTSLSTATVAENIARAMKRFRNGKTTTTGDHQAVYPGIHVVYEPANSLLVRASYTNSVSRPGIGDLLPRTTIESVGRVRKGNPNLKPYRSKNFDVSVEKYFEPIGMLSAGVFLKEISDYYRSFRTTIGTGADNGFDGQYAGYSLDQPQNVGDARIRGIEFGYQQQYSFLPGFLSGLGGYANFTYLQTQGNYGAAGPQRLAQFPPRSVNAGISYVKYGLQARILYNWKDRTYDDSSYPTTVWVEPRGILDIKLQYSIGPSYDIFLDVGNLTNEPSAAFYMEDNLKYLRFDQGTSYLAGVKFRF